MFRFYVIWCAMFSCIMVVAPSSLGDRYVESWGQDIGRDCTDPGQPCATVAYAVFVATNVQEHIQIGEGIFQAHGVVLSNQMTLSGVGSTSTILQASSTLGQVTNHILSIPLGITAEVSRITLRHGYTLNQGGGIHNLGRTTLIDAWVETCRAETAGGGVYNTGSLLMFDSAISNCTTAGDGGGLFNAGGIIYLSGSHITHNTAEDDGGGLENLGHADILNTTIAHNTADDKGGGLRNTYVVNASNLWVTANHASSEGGGIHNIHTMNLDSSLITSNRLAGENGDGFDEFGESSFGGGIYNNGSLYLEKCQLTYNVSVGGRSAFELAGSGRGGGLFCRESSAVIDCEIRYNGANGGFSAYGHNGLGAGGGIYSEKEHFLTNTLLIGNSASSGGHYRYSDGNAGRGGGIYLEGSATLIDCAVESNFVVGSDYSLRMGGGVFISGVVTMKNLHVTHNRATGMNGWSGSLGSGSGGLPGYGGGICNEGYFNIENSIISFNECRGGAPQGYRDGGTAGAGGIMNAGTGRVVNCAIDNNYIKGIDGGVAYGNGGEVIGAGIYNNGVLEVVGSSISRNRGEAGRSPFALFSAGPDALGGGVYNEQTLELENSTIAENYMMAGSALGYHYNNPNLNPGGNAHGAGIFNEGFGETDIQNSTIAWNETAFGYGLLENGSDQGAGVYNTSGVVRIRSSIISDNSNREGVADVFGPVMSEGFNLISETQGLVFTQSAATDVLGVSASLGRPAMNGGPTLTCALFGDSPARDQGSAGTNLVMDQRGFPRVVAIPGLTTADDGCDIGAYEISGQDVGIRKSAILHEGHPDYDIEYIVEVSALGLSNLTGVTVSDPIAPEIQWETVSNSWGTAVTMTNEVTWQVGLLPPGTVWVGRIYASVVESNFIGDVTNIASVTVSESEITLSNNQSGVITIIADHDLDGVSDLLDEDNDGDGIPDHFENQHGLNPNQPEDAPQHWDDDGFSNLEEYISGTDPQDGNAYFKVNEIAHPNAMQFFFHSVSGRVYTLQSKEMISLTNEWMNLPGQTQVYSDGSITGLVDTADTTNSRVYRVLVELP